MLRTSSLQQERSAEDHGLGEALLLSFCAQDSVRQSLQFNREEASEFAVLWALDPTVAGDWVPVHRIGEQGNVFANSASLEGRFGWVLVAQRWRENSRAIAEWPEVHSDHGPLFLTAHFVLVDCEAREFADLRRITFVEEGGRYVGDLRTVNLLSFDWRSQNFEIIHHFCIGEWGSDQQLLGISGVLEFTRSSIQQAELEARE